MALVRHRGFMSSGQSFGVPSDMSYASSSSSFVHQAAILMSSGTSMSSYSSSPAGSDPDKPVGYGAFGVVWCVAFTPLTLSTAFDLSTIILINCRIAIKLFTDRVDYSACIYIGVSRNTAAATITVKATTMKRSPQNAAYNHGIGTRKVFSEPESKLLWVQ